MINRDEIIALARSVTHREFTDVSDGDDIRLTCLYNMDAEKASDAINKVHGKFVLATVFRDLHTHAVTLCVSSWEAITTRHWL